MKCAEGDYEMHLELLFKHLWCSVQYLSAHKLQPYSFVKTFSQSRNGLRINGVFSYYCAITFIQFSLQQKLQE